MKSMKKKIAAAVVTSSALIGLSMGTSFAWTYSLQGAGNCQPDGSFKITWTVTNPENEALQITNSSNQSVVPIGTQVAPSPPSTTYTQTADGTKAGSFNLTLTGHFASDTTDRTMSDTVALVGPCAQPVTPVTPPTGGHGSGTPTVPVEKASAKVPAGPVNAGGGGAATEPSLGALVGFTGSLAGVGLGIRRLNKQSL